MLVCTLLSIRLPSNCIKIIKDNGYISDYDYVDDGKGGQLTIKLIKI